MPRTSIFPLSLISYLYSPTQQTTQQCLGKYIFSCLFQNPVCTHHCLLFYILLTPQITSESNQSFPFLLLATPPIPQAEFDFGENPGPSTRKAPYCWATAQPLILCNAAVLISRVSFGSLLQAAALPGSFLTPSSRPGFTRKLFLLHSQVPPTPSSAALS